MIRFDLWTSMAGGLKRELSSRLTLSFHYTFRLYHTTGWRETKWSKIIVYIKKQHDGKAPSRGYSPTVRPVNNSATKVRLLYTGSE